MASDQVSPRICPGAPAMPFWTEGSYAQSRTRMRRRGRTTYACLSHYDIRAGCECLRGDSHHTDELRRVSAAAAATATLLLRRPPQIGRRARVRHGRRVRRVVVVHRQRRARRAAGELLVQHTCVGHLGPWLDHRSRCERVVSLPCPSHAQLLQRRRSVRLAASHGTRSRDEREPSLN